MLCVCHRLDLSPAGLVELVNRCLSFSATDRPEFREVLPILEAEYRALRARQPPRPQQRDHSQQPQQLMPPHQQLLPPHQLHAGEEQRSPRLLGSLCLAWLCAGMSPAVCSYPHRAS